MVNATRYRKPGACLLCEGLSDRGALIDLVSVQFGSNTNATGICLCPLASCKIRFDLSGTRIYGEQARRLAHITASRASGLARDIWRDSPHTGLVSQITAGNHRGDGKGESVWGAA